MICAWLYFCELTFISIGIIINTKEYCVIYYYYIILYRPAAHALEWAAILEWILLKGRSRSRCWTNLQYDERFRIEHRTPTGVPIYNDNSRYPSSIWPRLLRTKGTAANKITPGRWLQRLVPGLLSFKIQRCQIDRIPGKCVGFEPSVNNVTYFGVPKYIQKLYYPRFAFFVQEF